MARYNSRALQVLDRIYKFVGDKALGREMELSVPIQPVHDLSREAELGAGHGGTGGWIAYAHSQQGIGQQESSVDVFAYIQPFLASVPLENIDVWLMDVFCTTENEAAFVNATAAVCFPITEANLAGITGSSELQYRLVGNWDDAMKVADKAGTNVDLVGVLKYNTFLTPIGRGLPMRVFRGSFFTLLTNSGANDTTLTWIMWVGPKGVPPPGVA